MMNTKEQTNADGNSEVLVSPEKVSQLQRRYSRACAWESVAKTELARCAWKARKEALEEALAVIAVEG